MERAFESHCYSNQKHLRCDTLEVDVRDVWGYSDSEMPSILIPSLSATQLGNYVIMIVLRNDENLQSSGSSGLIGR